MVRSCNGGRQGSSQTGTAPRGAQFGLLVGRHNHSPATHTCLEHTASTQLLEPRVVLRCPAFGRQRSQTTSLEHQTCTKSTASEESLSFDCRVHVECIS